MYNTEVITPAHRTRKAVIYIRQSTPHQALSHQESLRLQYALTERARDLGWATEGIGGYSNKKPEYLVYQEEGMDEAFRVVSDVAGER